MFIMNECWIVSNGFSVSVEIIMFLAFSFNTEVNHIDFAYVEPTLWPWNEYNLSMAYDPFYVLLDSIG